MSYHNSNSIFFPHPSRSIVIQQHKVKKYFTKKEMKGYGKFSINPYQGVFMKRWIVFFIALLPSLYASGQEVPKLTLSSSATISKPADELRLKIGVVTHGKTAQAALAENSEKMRHVFEDLARIGMSEDDYETHQFNINPTYTPPPRDPPPYWTPSINGYEATNTIQIHTSKLDLAGAIIDVANSAGANTISDIHFTLSRPRNYWTEALTAAGHNAVSDAEAIAQATGVRLVRVLSISLNNTQVRSPHLNYLEFCKVADASTPIEPGDVSIEASVTLVYEISSLF